MLKKSTEESEKRNYRRVKNGITIEDKLLVKTTVTKSVWELQNGNMAILLTRWKKKEEKSRIIVTQKLCLVVNI